MSVAEFQKLHEHLDSLRKEGKFEEAFSIYSDDCYCMTPFAPPTAARDTVKLANNPKLESFAKAESKVHVDDVKKEGDLFIDRGHFEFKHPEGDKKGSYLMLWKKQAKEWKCTSACFNIQIMEI